MSTTAYTPTTDDLKAAYRRAPLLRLAGYSFERALATPLVRKGMEISAKAHARKDAGPVQPSLI